MKLYEVTIRDTNTGANVVYEVEAHTREEAEKKVRAVFGRPNAIITATLDTLFRTAS